VPFFSRFLILILLPEEEGGVEGLGGGESGVEKVRIEGEEDFICREKAL